MDAQGIDERLRGFPHRDTGHMECGCFVGFAHVAGPLGMERIPALRVGLFSLSGFVPLVARIQMTFEHQVAIRDRPGIDGSGFHDPDRESLDGSGRPQFIAASR